MNESDEAAPKSSSANLGQRLTAAREKWGLSVEEAAQCLNLRADAIKALEQEAYENLPGCTFALGYLRAYAKLLKLDHKEIIAGLRLEKEKDCEILYAKTPVLPSTHFRSRPGKRDGFLFRFLLIVGVLAGLTGVAVTQLPDLGVNKILKVTGLSTPLGDEEKSFGRPLATENGSSGEQAEPQDPVTEEK